MLWLLVLLACGGAGGEAEGQPPVEAEVEQEVQMRPAGRAAPKMRMMTLGSSAFQHKGEIPVVHTCEGDDLAPALSWTDVPGGTKSVALVVEDPDVPDPANPQRSWVHWVAYDLPPEAGGIPEGGALPEGGIDGHNDWGKPGYGGPCPPTGRHRYIFKLYALDTVLPVEEGVTKARLTAMMAGHIVGRAKLLGLYEKTGATTASP